MALVPIFSYNMLAWTSMVTRKHFWRPIFGICEKYEANHTADWSQNYTSVNFWPFRALKQNFRLPEVVLS